MRGKWVFIDMINEGLLALLRGIKLGVFCFGEDLRFRFNVYRLQAIQKVTINIRTMLKHMIRCYNMMWLVLLCWWFHLNGVYCKGFANSNSKVEFKICHMHICYCCPILKWLNKKTNCIFIFLGFCWSFLIYKLFSSELWFKRYCKFHF